MTSTETSNRQWIDTHCHLQLGEDGKGALHRALSAGVTQMVCVGTDAQTSAEALEVAEQAGGPVFASIGLHPHDAKNGMDDIIALLNVEHRKNRNLLVGIGECGLDYFYEHSPRHIQQEIFKKHIALAKEFDLTLIIHTRDAWDDTFEILRTEGVPPRTVVHCFTGGPDEAQKALELGMYLSFSGIVTFPKSLGLQEAARICPVESLLIETDSPFLTPVPLRGKLNEPANVGRIGEFISALKNMQVDDFSMRVMANSRAAFAL